jgi:exonuclease III
MGHIIFYVYLFSIFSIVLSDIQCPIPTSYEDRRTNQNKFRFVQYNTEWLFVDYCSSSQCPGSGCPWENTTEAEIHLEYVSTVIYDLNPDIINICEVEGCDELTLLIGDKDTNTNKYIPYLIKGTDTSTGQNVGILTKIDPIISLYRTEERVSYPIPNSTCGYTGSPSTSGVSKHYITEININYIPTAVIGTHLLAFPTDVQRCAQREAQAQVLQNVIIQYIKKGFEIILSGDLNDFDGEILDANNNKPLSSVLDIFKGFAGTYKNSYTLYSVNEYMKKSMIYSDWWDKNGDCVSSSTEFSMIDHILVSKYLFDSIENVFVYQNYSEFCGTYNSDHYPLVVDFSFI